MKPYRATPIDKPVDSGEFVYGWYIKYQSQHFIFPIKSNKSFLGRFIEVHPSTVGQQVGLKDKHGKEIYKGDQYKEGNKTFTVVFASGSFMGDWMNGSSQRFIDHENIEIIGNIHTENQNGTRTEISERND